MSVRPLVTVVIPARDEEGDIERCLRAVLAQDYPAERLEVLVVDGGSTDRTVARARRALAGAPVRHWAVVPNPAATTPSNLNVGLAAASGTVLCRVDARSLVPVHYVSTCVDVLDRRPDVAVVGGAQVAVAPVDGAVAAGIARGLNNRFAMGMSRYRRGAASGPADTVYLGSFRTAEVRAAGGWNESFATNQDFELNRRMARHGLVWFDARLEVGYVPRSSVAAIHRQYRRFGRWKVRYWRTTGDRPRPRQIALLVTPVLVALPLVRATARGGRRGLVGMAGGAVLAALTVDASGARATAAGTPAGWTTRAVSILTMAAVASGWLGGVWGGLRSGPRP